MHARVVIIAGPSGAGKSRLAARLGYPVLNLDDFYRDAVDAGDPGSLVDLPRLPDGSIDWDDPGSWHHDEAIAALEELCRVGRAEVPTYSIAGNARTGSRVLDLAGSPLFVAEGIFAAEVVQESRRRGLVAEALCVTQHPAITFWRRLARDLREHRKPPLLLVRRGLRLAREQSSVVAHAVALGCDPVDPDEGFDRVRRIGSASTPR